MALPGECINLVRRSGIPEIIDPAAGRGDLLRAEVEQPDFEAPGSPS